jgi:CRP-like cAMP-binding protein
MRTICDILSGQAFFKELTADQIGTLSDNAKYRRFRTNELVFHQGNLANRFYVLVNGKVVLEATGGDGRLVRYQTAGAGELLGWSWMFSASMKQLQARALEPTEAIYFCGDSLRQLCDKDHDLGYELFRRVAEVMMQRLQAPRQLLLEQPLPAPAEDSEWRPGEPQAALAANPNAPSAAI